MTYPTSDRYNEMQEDILDAVADDRITLETAILRLTRMGDPNPEQTLVDAGVAEEIT